MKTSPFTWTAVRAVHPRQVAAAATLNGLSSPGVGSARILVLGIEDCGDVVPLAAYQPNATIIATDSSPEKLDTARTHLEALGIDSVQLVERSPGESLDDLGELDYILVRGAMNRLDEHGRLRLLESCSSVLGPRGFVVFGYAALPGWGPMAQLGAWLTRRVGDEASATERVTRARELARSFQPVDGDEPDPTLVGLASVAAAFDNMDDREILDDVLDPRVRGLSLSDLTAEAEETGLSYVGDTQRDPARAQLRRRLAEDLGEELKTTLELDELADLALPRSRRFSVFAGSKKTLGPSAMLVDLDGRNIAARLMPQKGKLDLNAELETFEGHFGVTMDVESRLLRATLTLVSGTWPQSVPIGPVVQQAAHVLASADPRWAAEVDQAELNETKLRLLHLCELGLADLMTEPLTIAEDVGPRPLAHELVRYQAAHGTWVTSPLHLDVELSPFLLALVGALDGESDGDRVQQRLAEAMATGEFQLELEGKEPADEVSRNLVLRSFIMRGLEDLRGLGLLSRQNLSPT